MEKLKLTKTVNRFITSR
ncbi:hypothetical protein Godav_020787 [Gossypium davidsonii]|uniref:Uncharacterized protein n=2 Tax=Gossypium TaxID=3633 RepID=A0A7J8R419_GOSDV|nr:hypothetical protein [Gossypium davidsonii]MBA0643616.1 hypothetical protein [Gossypium klotzschianum]